MTEDRGTNKFKKNYFNDFDWYRLSAILKVIRKLWDGYSPIYFSKRYL